MLKLGAVKLLLYEDEFKSQRKDQLLCYRWITNFCGGCLTGLLLLSFVTFFFMIFILLKDQFLKNIMQLVVYLEIFWILFLNILTLPRNVYVLFKTYFCK